MSSVGNLLFVGKTRKQAIVVRYVGTEYEVTLGVKGEIIEMEMLPTLEAVFSLTQKWIMEGERHMTDTVVEP